MLQPVKSCIKPKVIQPQAVDVSRLLQENRREKAKKAAMNNRQTRAAKAVAQQECTDTNKEVKRSVKA